MNDMSYFIQVITNGLVSSGVYILISLGLALALGVLNILNIAHGQLMIFTAYLTYWAWRLYGVDPIASILFTVPIGFLLGIVLYKGSIERVLTAPHINQLLLTFGIAIILSSVMELVWTADVRFVSTSYQATSLDLGIARIGLLPLFVLFLSASVCVLLHTFLTRTKMGKAIRAVSQNPKGASILGINIKIVHMITFGVSISLASLAGVFWLLIGYVNPYVGDLLTLKAFCIVVVAGLGNIFGVVWASILLGLGESLVKGYLSSGWSDAIFFGIIIVVLIYRSLKEVG